MRIVYYSKPYFTDCDFPLIKEMQTRGVDVRYYLPVGHRFQKKSILDLETPICKWGIYKASKIKGMEKYKDCLNLDNMYFICGKNKKWWPMSWLLWFGVFIHILFYRAEILHITWQLCGFDKFLLYIPFIRKKVITVHDPLQHSGTKNEELQEKARKRTFKWAQSFILLNSQQVDCFSNKYNISKEMIFVSKLGVYDSIKYVNKEENNYKKPYILFFGQILPYKGIEYLLEAMLKVNVACPNVNLIIAGGGQIYFDVSKYKNLDYIIFENRYIGIAELAGMINKSLFVVCPYKDATQSGVIQTAFALDTPVVATNVGALANMVNDGVYGIIVPPCDSISLASVLIELINNPKKLKLFKENIRQQWLPTMSWKDIVDDYLVLYNN